MVHIDGYDNLYRKYGINERWDETRLGEVGTPHSYAAESLTEPAANGEAPAAAIGVRR